MKYWIEDKDKPFHIYSATLYTTVPFFLLINIRPNTVMIINAKEVMVSRLLLCFSAGLCKKSMKFSGSTGLGPIKKLLTTNGWIQIFLKSLSLSLKVLLLC